jgi:CDP-diacylglycerol--serine O-phosphatidyltransferase
VAAWQVAIGFLMISRVPTFSFKRVHVRREYVLPTLLIVGLLAAVMVSYPWFVISAAVLAYLLVIPFSMRSHRRFASGRRGPVPGARPSAKPTVTEPPSHQTDERG